MAADLSCGCRTAPKERLCSYHEGRADERDLIVQWLLREPTVWLNRAAWAIERGEQSDGSKCPECNGERVIRNEWTGEVDRCPTCTPSDGPIAGGSMES